MSGKKDLSVYKGKALVFTSQEEQVENELFSTLNTEIEIKKDQFHNIWPGWYPRKELTNQIGAGMGIEFSPDVKFDEVFGDVTEYTDGRKVRKVEGYRCTKSGKRRRPDGTWSSWSEPYEFNWVNRAELDFLADDEKPEKERKYTTDKKKHQHVAELKKFATQRASTGSDLCVIRALTGMQTSFKANEIAIGKIVVSQIVESKLYQAKKAQANIDNIRMGGDVASNVEDASTLLIGKAANVTENTNKIAPDKKEDSRPEAATPNIDEPITIEEQFEELIKDPQVIALKCLGGSEDSKEKISASVFYKNVVEDNGGGVDVLSWAVAEIMTRINK